MAEKKRGVRHIDRLMQVFLEIAEDAHQDTTQRIAAAKEASTLIKARRPSKHDKKKQAIKNMLGTANQAPAKQ